MALTEAQRHDATEKLLTHGQQVFHKILVVRCHIPSKRSRASSARCLSHHARSSRNASRRLTRNTSTSQRTRQFTPCSSSYGMPGKQLT